jgi:hypothetical protein
MTAPGETLMSREEDIILISRINPGLTRKK